MARVRAGWRRPGFGVALGAIALAALALRALYVATIAPPPGLAPDAFYFASVGRALAEGRGFTEITGQLTFEPTAGHPPGYPVLLAGLAKLGLSGNGAFRAASVATGALVVAAIGLLGRRAAGPAVGLVAAAIAAVYPTLIAADGALLSESLYGLCVVVAMLLAYRLLDRPSAGRAAVLGGAMAAATLVRAEALLLVPLLGLPLAWRGGEGRRLRVAALMVVFALALAPWVARNWVVFDRPVLSNNLGYLLASTNCPDAYHGRNTGWLGKDCARPLPGDEAERSRRWLDQAAGYVGEHPGRALVVAAVRGLRMVGLYQPFRAAREQERNVKLQEAGIALFYPLAALAIAGVVLLRRRRRPLIVLGAPLVVALVTVMAGWGSLRLRHGAEPSIVVLAAVPLGSRAWPRRQG